MSPVVIVPLYGGIVPVPQRRRAPPVRTTTISEVNRWRDRTLDAHVLRRVAILSGIGALTNTAVAATRPLISIKALELGASPIGIGLVVALFAFIPLFLAIPAGMVVDRMGARTYLFLGSLGMALSMGIVALLPSFGGLILAQLGTGLCHLAVVVACQTAVSRQGGPADREATLGMFTMFMSGGGLIGPLLGGFTADVLGFRAAFAVAGLTVLIGAALVAAVRPSQPGNSPRNALGSGERVPVLPLLRNPAIILSTGTGFTLIFALGAWEAFFPIWMQGLGHSTTLIGMILSLQALVSLLSRTGLKRLTVLMGSRFRLLIAAMTLGGIAVGLLPLSSGIIQIGMLSVLAGISTGMVFPLGMIAVAAGTTDRERGLGMGIRLTGNRLAQLTNPLLFGVIANQAGLSAAFYAASAILLVVTALVMPFPGALPEVERE